MTRIRSFKDLTVWQGEKLVTQLIPRPRPLINGVLRHAANGLIAALLAPPCAVCDAVLDEPLRGCVCGNCWGAIRPITPPLCDSCGDPLARPNQSPIPNLQSQIRDSRSLCPQCRNSVRAINRSCAVGEYDGALREIIHAFKYRGRRSLARPIAARMRSRGTELLEGADCVVPVPLHWRRAYRRGFNQARELARYLGRPVIDALVRRRHTRPQVELAANLRRASVETAFGLRHPSRSIEGLTIVLVDDVSTTGATLEACARVLKEAGVSEVYALTAARVFTRPPNNLI